MYGIFTIIWGIDCIDGSGGDGINSGGNGGGLGGDVVKKYVYPSLNTRRSIRVFSWARVRVRVRVRGLNLEGSML
jgi:hypothetical protein